MDIVERLRRGHKWADDRNMVADANEAADKIEKLRGDLEFLFALEAEWKDDPKTMRELFARLRSDNERMIEALEEIERQCVQADDPEHHTLGLVKHIARSALSQGQGEGK